jgi:competence protein ComEC
MCRGMPPTLQFTLILAAGVAVGVTADPALTRWTVPLLAVSAVAGLMADPRGQRWLRRTLFAVTLASAAVAHGAHAVDRAERTGLRRWIEPRVGSLADTAADPRIEETVTLQGRLLRDAAPTESGAVLQVAVSAASLGSWLEQAAGGVLLNVAGSMVAERLDDWRAGRTIRVHAGLRRPAVYLNRGVPNAERALARRGVTLVGSVKSASLVEVIRPGRPWDEWAAEVRARVRRAMARHVGRHAPLSAGIGTAILIGDRASLTPEVEQRLMEAGTYHVVAISGGNIALLTGAVLGVLWAFRIRFAWAAGIAIVIIGAHAWTIGGGSSVVRATVMAVLYLALRLIDQRTAPVNAVALGATLMLIADPLEIAAAGFWLTFGATAALVAAASRWPADGRGWWWAPLVISAGSLAVELVLAPVSAFVFQRVTLAGLVLNLGAVPSMALVQAAGSATVLGSWLGWASLADASGFATHLAATALVESARLVDLAPWATWRVPSPSWMAMAAYYACLSASWLASRPPIDTRGRRLASRGFVASALALWLWIVVAPASLVRARGDGLLHVAMLDVGQGDAMLVRLPNGRTLVVDSGGVPSGSAFDIGDRVLGPALRAMGIRRLDYLAITHGDPDHIGGAASLVRDFEPLEVWSGVPVAGHKAEGELKFVASKTRSVWRWLQRGDRLAVGPVELRVHHPPLPEWERQRVRNDDSLVFELRFGQVSVLLTGDVSLAVEQELLPRLDLLPTVVLKAPHHGSATSSSPELLAHIRPRIILVGAGRGNLYGHPNRAVVDRYTAAGAEILRTDRDGQIELVTDGERLSVRTFTGRTWEAR